MIYDIPSVTDYAEAIDTQEKRLSDARRERDAAMAALEASRRGLNPLSKSDYSDQKVRHGNADADVREAKHYLRSYSEFYHGDLSFEWICEQEEMTVRRGSLSQVWQEWRKVLAAREALADLEVKCARPARKYFEDDYGNDVPVIFFGSARERIEAQIAVERAEGMYDAVLRAFEGRPARTREQTLKLRVSKPTKALPSKRIMSMPTKYVRGPNGTKIPRS